MESLRPAWESEPWLFQRHQVPRRTQTNFGPPTAQISGLSRGEWETEMGRTSQTSCPISLTYAMSKLSACPWSEAVEHEWSESQFSRFVLIEPPLTTSSSNGSATYPTTAQILLDNIPMENENEENLISQWPNLVSLDPNSCCTPSLRAEHACRSILIFSPKIGLLS